MNVPRAYVFALLNWEENNKFLPSFGWDAKHTPQATHSQHMMKTKTYQKLILLIGRLDAPLLFFLSSSVSFQRDWTIGGKIVADRLIIKRFCRRRHKSKQKTMKTMERNRSTFRVCPTLFITANLFTSTGAREPERLRLFMFNVPFMFLAFSGVAASVFLFVFLNKYLIQRLCLINNITCILLVCLMDVAWWLCWWWCA